MDEAQAKAAEAASEAAEAASEAAEEAAEAAEEAEEATDEAAEAAEEATKEATESELAPSTERDVGRMEAQIDQLREEAIPELRGRMEALETNQETTLGEVRSMAGSLSSLADMVATMQANELEADEDEIDVLPEPEPEPEPESDETEETPARARTGLARLILGP